MDNVTFRSIVPIHQFAFEQADGQFLHSGNYQNATFTISLSRCDRTKDGFDKLLEGVDKWIREQLASKYAGVEGTNYYLVVDVTQPIGDELKVPGNSFESIHIPNTMIEALRLHSSRGLLFVQTYQFQLHHSDELITSRPTPSQYLFPHQGFPAPSILLDSEFEPCRHTFDVLLRKVWEDEFTLDRLLRLALEYHKATFNLSAVEHSFLILMVVFEALFKKKQESNTSQAAIRVAKLLSDVQNEKLAIQKDFFDSDPQSFCNIRNDIVHGNPDLNLQVVRSRYPLLYQYITKAIVRLLVIQNGAIDHTKDYYDEISKFVNGRFATLASS